MIAWSRRRTAGSSLARFPVTICPLSSCVASPDDHTIYERLLPLLSPKRAVAFDWHGYGRSDRSEPGGFSMKEHAAELEALLDALDMSGQRAAPRRTSHRHGPTLKAPSGHPPGPGKERSFPASTRQKRSQPDCESLQTYRSFGGHVRQSTRLRIHESSLRRAGPRPGRDRVQRPRIPGPQTPKGDLNKLPITSAGSSPGRNWVRRCSAAAEG
jgi:hypothetical protein